MIRDNQREISSRANYRVGLAAAAQRAATRTDKERASCTRDPFQAMGAAS